MDTRVLPLPLRLHNISCLIHLWNLNCESTTYHVYEECVRQNNRDAWCCHKAWLQKAGREEQAQQSRHVAQRSRERRWFGLRVPVPGIILSYPPPLSPLSLFHCNGVAARTFLSSFVGKYYDCLEAAEQASISICQKAPQGWVKVPY